MLRFFAELSLQIKAGWTLLFVGKYCVFFFLRIMKWSCISFNNKMKEWHRNVSVKGECLHCIFSSPEKNKRVLWGCLIEQVKHFFYLAFRYARKSSFLRMRNC